MSKIVVVLFLAAVVAACGCQSGPKDVMKTPELARHEQRLWPGEATPFGVAKGRRQVSTWHWQGGWERIEPYADIISSVSMFGGLSKEFVDQCHAANIEVYMPICSARFDTPEHIEASVREALERCEKLGVDGVDLDLERFGAEWRKQYTAYIVAMADALHRKGLKLSICVNVMMPGDAGAWQRYDPKVVGEVCDQIRVMCYDYVWARGGQLGPTATRGWARDAMRAWLNFAPREKLVMGLPAYSHDVDLVTGKGSQAGAGAPPVDREAIVKYGALRYEAVHYYLYRDKEQHLHLWFASDAYSTRAHLATVDELDIPAVSFWTASKLTPEMWQTLRDWLTKDPELVIEADPRIFVDTMTVRVRTLLDGYEARYTVDGTEPAADSPLYTKPLVLSETTTIKARVFRDGRAAGFKTPSKTVTKVRPRPAEELGEVAPGLSFAYYEGKWERPPDFDSLQPVAKGGAPMLDISERRRDDFFGFRFNGYIKVPSSGVYTFFARSDDGLRLWIGDKLVIDDYGLHPAREVQGSIALAPGLHPIKADYFEWDGNERLTVSYEGPGIEKRPVPAEVLFHKP